MIKQLDSVETKWVIADRTLSFEAGPKVMGILNVTPDSFSDGGKYSNLDSARARAEEMVAEGAEILDVGGESTRPGSERVDAEDEIRRVVPVIEAIGKVSDIPVSVDTSKSIVAKAAIDAGAVIINDISGLRFDPELAGVASDTNSGLVLMHLRGEFDSMHHTEPNADIVEDVITGFRWSIKTAAENGIGKNRICLDIGIGFSKTLGQNLRLLHYLEKIQSAFMEMPIMIGVSRKSFIGKITGQIDPKQRIAGTIAANCAAVLAGAQLLRVHDIKETVDALKILGAIRSAI